MALYLHSSHLKFGFIAKSWLPVCFSFYRVFFVVIWHNAGYDYLRRQMRAHTALGQCTEHECYGIGITILQTNAKLVHNGCTTLHVFFQCSRKAPETQNSQRYRFPFVMFVSHVLPNSEHFPHWWQLCVPAPAPCLLFRCLVDRPYPDNKQEDSTWILTQDDSGQYWTHHHNFHFLWVLMFACGHSGNFEVVMFPNGCCD